MIMLKIVHRCSFQQSVPLKTFWKNIKNLNKNSYCSSCFNSKSVPLSRNFSQTTVKFCTKEAKQKLLPTSFKDFKRLLLISQPEKWKILGAVVLLFISSGVSMAVPFGIGRVIDIIYSQLSDPFMLKKLSSFCQLLLCIFILGAVANFGRVYLMQIAGHRIINRWRVKLFDSILRQEVGFFDKTKTGELISRLSSDTSLMGQTLTQNISDGLRSSVHTVGGICMMAFVSPKLTLLALCVVPPIALSSIFYGRYLKMITRDVQTSLASSTQVATERIANIRTVKAFGQEDCEKKSYEEKIQHVLGLSYKESLARALFWSFNGLSGNLIVLSVFYYGGTLMQESLITVGQLSSFILYAAYVGVSMGGLSSFYSELMKGLGASSRLWELSDRRPEIHSTGFIPSGSLRGDIEFRNVSFSYPSRADLAVLDGLSLSVPHGTSLAVVGASGTGKSTLVSLLLRLYEPNDGQIAIGGTNIDSVDVSYLRSHFGLVAQEPAMFSCSILQNIAYGAGQAGQVAPRQVEEAAAKANALEFIERFPEGLETVVGERGVLLSGGQKQRIAIARAIIKNPKYLLLDEATSALDSASEQLVQQALQEIMKGRTVITIAHRLATIKNVDFIAVIRQGRVVEYGNYSMLINREGGIFKDLVEKQTLQV